MSMELLELENELNIGVASEQNLFVEGNSTVGQLLQYVKLGSYGLVNATTVDGGTFFASTATGNVPKYSLGTGTNGKIVQDERIITISVAGNAFKNLKTTGTVLIPTPGSNSLIWPMEVLVRNSGGAKGTWIASDTAGIGFQTSATLNYPSGFNNLFVINAAGLQKNNEAWWFCKSPANTGLYNNLNKPLLLCANNNLTGSKDVVPAGTWYIQIRYMVLNVTGNLSSNVDRAMTSNS